MKSDKREISKRDFKWLYSAIKEEWCKQVIHISDTAAIATNGMKLHAININELPDKFDGLSRDDIFNKISGEAQSEFLVNPEYLVDALKGFSDCVKVELVGDDSFWGIRLSDGDSDKIAFIACMEKEEEDD
jgi:hypothetical protein